MPAAPLRVLITGFGPFPGIIDNASATFAPVLAHHIQQTLPQLQTGFAILPTEWDAAPRLLRRLLNELRPHLCLHFGVSGAARGLVLETVARNSASERPDATGWVPLSRVLQPGAPALLMPPIGPFRLMGRALRDGLPISPSVNAGTYVCNAVFFHSLWQARRLVATGPSRRLAAFVHLPVRVGGAGEAEDASLNATDLPLQQALAGSFSILSAMAEVSAAAMVPALA